MRLRLLGWLRPRQQHDVAELIDFLQPRLVRPAPSGCWETRQHTDAGISRTPPVSMLRCLQLLVEARSPTPDIQTLINRWHTQSAMHAMTEAPPWLFVQIPRFLYRSRGRPVKQSQAYILPPSLLLPVFADSVSLTVHWREYRVGAWCIQHHGLVPSQDHYTAVAFHERGKWMLDDGKEQIPLDAEQADHLSVNVYVLLLTRATAALSSSEASQSLLGVSAKHHGCPSSAENPERAWTGFPVNSS